MLRAFLVIGLLVALVGARPAMAAGQKATACKLAVQVTREMLDARRPWEKTVVAGRAGSYFRTTTVGGRTFDSFAQWRSGPLAPLIRSYEAGPRANALAECAELRTLLDSRGVPYGTEAAEAARKAVPFGPEPGTTIFWILLPAVSADGRDALVEFGSSCHGLCGHGALDHYQRGNDGLWRAKARGPFWLS